MSPRRVFTLLLLLAVTSSAIGFRLAGGPGGGGTIPGVMHGTVSAGASIVALSPGKVLTIQGNGVSGLTVVARTPLGVQVDIVQTSRSGSFTLETPVQGPFFLEVVGTGVSTVPFMPMTPIVVVLP